jgi:hypothetical protein
MLRCLLQTAVTTTRRANFFAQSASDMAGGFTFGATIRGFFIVTIAFFSGMVVAGGRDGRGLEGGEESGDKVRSARRRRKACSVREPAGAVGNGR